MGRFIASDIVLVHFPFDDLSASKLRPGLVLAESRPNSYLVAAVTSQEKRKIQGAIEITKAHLSEGKLNRTSYIRPDVLFTAHDSIVERRVGRLQAETHSTIIEAIHRHMIDHAPKDSKG